MEGKKKLYKTRLYHGVAWVDKPKGSDGLWACWVYNPTYPLCHFLLHSTVGVLSSARRLVILFFRMGINRAYGLHRFLHYSEMQKK